MIQRARAFAARYSSYDHVAEASSPMCWVMRTSIAGKLDLNGPPKAVPSSA